MNLLLATFILVAAPDSREKLADHLASQLASRTNGASSDYLITKTNQVYFHGSPSVVTNYWLRDVTNINATSAGRIDGTHFNVGGCLSAVSPRHCITANHVGAYPAQPAVWVLDTGGLYTNTITAWTNSGDLLVCLMANTNPCFYKVLPDLAGKVKFNPAAGTPPVAVRLHDASRNTAAVTSFASGYRGVVNGYGSFAAYLWGQLAFGDYALGDAWVIGDSSSAAIMVIQNEAIFICASYTGGAGPQPGANTNGVNALMLTLSTNATAPIYQVTVKDLASFRDL